MNRVVGIYKAEIYECNRHVPYCNKRNCSKEYCSNISDKTYAKDYIEESTCPPIELKLYQSG